MIEFYVSNDGYTYLMVQGRVVSKARTEDFMIDMNAAAVRAFKQKENHKVQFKQVIEVPLLA